MDGETFRELHAPLPTARPRTSAGASSGSRSSGVPISSAAHVEQLLARRVLSVEAFAAEQRHAIQLSRDERIARFGTSTVPIPVALARGESEAQYEAKFRKWLADKSVAGSDLVNDPNRERTLRISFALHAVERAKRSKTASSSRLRAAPRALARREGRPDTERPWSDFVDPRGRVDANRVPRPWLLLREYTTLDKFRRDTMSGHFRRQTELSYHDKMKKFGSPFAPIAVPLAPGETNAMYEARFVEWLQRTHRMTLAELERHPHHNHERMLRMKFSALNGKGEERFVPPRSPTVKRVRASSESRVDTSDARETKRHKEVCPGLDSIEACRACGCQRCLVSAIQQLSRIVAASESNASDRTAPVDLTEDYSEPVKRHGAGGEDEDDHAVEQQLLNEYDTINELIVVNENALDESAAEIVDLSKMSIADATLRQTEDEELREMLSDDIERRRMALAALMVFMHRDDGEVLEALTNPSDDLDVPHLQKLSHHKCAQLSVEIAELHTAAADLNVTVDAQGLNAQDRLDRLVALRRHELMIAVRSDRQVRALMRAMLTRAKDL